MFKLFAGDDNFASYIAAREYADQLVAKTNLELVILDGDELSTVADLLQPLESMSLFDSGKVVLAKRLPANTKLARYVEDNLENLKSKPLIIWHDHKLDARAGLAKSLKAAGLLQDFIIPADNDLAAWLVQTAKQSNVALPRSLASRLIEYKDNDRGILFQELQKLIIYSQATGKPLDQQILDSLTGAEAAGDIWKFLDALALGNKSTAMTEFSKLTAFTDNTQYLLSMLSRELMLMAKVVWSRDHNQSLQALKLHPFVLEKTTKKAARFSWPRIQKLSLALLRLDAAIKQGRIEEQSGLTVYLLTW